MWGYVILGCIILLLLFIIKFVKTIRGWIYSILSTGASVFTKLNNIYSCPTGTSTTNTGQQVNSMGCKCQQGYYWDGNTCLCPTGTSTFNYGMETDTRGCNCPQGYTWKPPICTNI